MRTWLAQHAGGASCFLTYAEVSARIQATAPAQRERLGPGAYRLGQWTIRLSKGLTRG